MLINKKAFGLYLGKARLRAGLSQGELAEKLGYSSPQFVSNWERGVANPPVHKLAQLTRLLNIPSDELIETILTETEQYLHSKLKSKRRNQA